MTVTGIRHSFLSACWLLLLSLLVLLGLSGYAGAVPQFNWGEQVRLAQVPGQRNNVSIPLQQIWESTRVGGVQMSNKQYFDPELVWKWPAQRFQVSDGSDVMTLQAGQRIVARVSLMADRGDRDLNLTFAMAKLDAVHVSYRYDSGPWQTLSAGDTLAMNDWSMPERQPSFKIHLDRGQLDIVVQLAHRGTVQFPVLLQNEQASISHVIFSNWTIGLLIGVSLVLAFMAVLLVFNFARASFLAPALMSVGVALMLFQNNGLGGMYWATSSDTLNDELKLLVHNLWALALPWAAATVLQMRQYAARWWAISVGLFFLGLLATVILMDYAQRDNALWLMPLVWGCTVIYVAVMVCWAWLRRISRQSELIAGLSAYALAVLIPIAVFSGWISDSAANFWMAACSTASSILLMYGLYLFHRMGRQVMARANMSPQRDVLTGLLNRDGFSRHLIRLRERIARDQTCSAFIYLSVADSEISTQIYGEEGFEMGMVQIAATLSSSVSGVDGLARISHHAFAVTVLMPPDPALATRLAQKILSRLMALGTHGTPLASSTRMVIAWLPLFGFKIDSLERRSLRTLIAMDEHKRIGWVGGQESHAEASQMLKDSRQSMSVSTEGAEDDDDNALLPKNLEQVSNLYERIRRIEREMLEGVDTRFLMAEAERMSRALNEAYSSKAHSSQGFPNSQEQRGRDHEPTQMMESPLDDDPTPKRTINSADLRPLEQWARSTGSVPLEVQATQPGVLDKANGAASRAKPDSSS